MKKILTSLAVLGIAILAIALTGTVYAHGPGPAETPQPDDPSPYGSGHMGGYGYGMMGGYGGYGGYGMMGGYEEEGPMHDVMIADLAEALDLPVEEIESRHDAGETLWGIAEAEGLSPSEIQELMFSAHNQTLEEAVADGWLTAEQAEWMDEHMDAMGDGSYNHCGGGSLYGSRSGGFGMGW